MTQRRRVGLGTYGLARVPREVATQIIRDAISLGVALIDTADVYGRGSVETLLAEISDRDVVIATKGGLVEDTAGCLRPAASPRQLRLACEASLCRLRREPIPLYQLHMRDPNVPLAESVGALAELRAEGKVARIGLCNVTIDEANEAGVLDVVDAAQLSVNMLSREHVDDVREWAGEQKLVLAASPLREGRLALAGPRVGRLAAKAGLTPAQYSLSWLLSLGPNIVPIPGTTSRLHLEDNLRVGRVEPHPSNEAR